MTAVTLPDADQAGHLPDGPSAPPAVQGILEMAAPRAWMRRLRARYGDAFTMHIPVFGRIVVISDPAQAKQLFTADQEVVDNSDMNLGRLLGPDSFFALSGDAHKRQRKLLSPPFHGRRLRAYEAIIEEETRREMAAWPEGAEFATLPSMMMITLNAILRAVFGAAGDDLAELRDLLPKLVANGSRLARLPIPRRGIGWWNPWELGEAYRAQYEAIVDGLIAQARQDPALDNRDDVLALMLQARYDDGTEVTRGEIGDQLLSLLTAGHETTATTLAWAIERLRRHPDILARLTAECGTGHNALREAVIFEVQRTRPVVDRVIRQVRVPVMRLGPWTLLRGQHVRVSIYLVHRDPDLFPNPERFDPDRFLHARPGTYEWIPFGGGARRCIGSAFAHMEMDVVLRTLLREFTLEPTAKRGERWHSRGIASCPAAGARAVVRRRAAATRV